MFHFDNGTSESGSLSVSDENGMEQSAELFDNMSTPHEWHQDECYCNYFVARQALQHTAVKCFLLLLAWIIK